MITRLMAVWRIMLGSVFLAGLLCLTLPVLAAQLVVNTAVDESDGSCSDGDCSLRDAIAVAASGDTITFGGDYAIYLDSQLDLTKTLTIDGSGHAVTISGDSNNDGSANVRVFSITAGKVVTLSYLSIVRGNADMGGGIYNAGTLTLQDSLLANNAATSNGGGAIWNEHGTLNLTRTTVVSNTAGYNGGGVFSRYGVVTLQNSTVSGNSVSNGEGGGIDSLIGSVILRNSTLSGNSALVNGGGTTNGGGIYHFGATLSLYNTLIANNTGGDCALTAGGVMAANVNNLIEDGSCNYNGVGFLSGDPWLGSLSDNGGQTLTHALLPGSKAIEAGNNASCLATDQRGVSRPQMARCDIGAYEAAPQLVLRLTKSVTPTGTVAYNGGVVTYTVVVSNVATVTDPYVMLTDTLPVGMIFKQWVTNPGATVSGNQITWHGTLGSQTRMTLTFQATHSAGLEIVNTAVVSDSIQLLQASATNTSPCQNALAVANGNDSGPGSLRQAIADTCAGGAITFANDISTYLNSELALNQHLTIDGSGHSVIISGDSGNDGSANVRAFNISAGTNVTLTHLTITHCYNDDGAGIYNSGTLNVIASTLSNNTSEFGGGAINNNGGVLKVYNSTLSGNSAGWGGAIRANEGTVVVQNSVLSGNSAGATGGAIDYSRNPLPPYTVVSSTLTVVSSTLSENSAVNGGGIQVQNAPLTVQSSLFLSNTASCTGGGIFYDVHNYAGSDRTVTIDNSTFAGNVASTIDNAYAWGGGAIYNYQGILTVRNSTFSGNAALQAEGGGIFTGNSATILNSTFISNTARDDARYGSGLVTGGSLDMKNTLIAGSFPGPDCKKIGSVSVFSFNSLVEDGTCSENGVNFLTGDPQVGPLADNGGVLIGPQADTPLLTHALLPGSQAIDTGDAASCLSLDQRGIARPQLSGCDRGAVEMRGFTLTLTGGNNQSTPVNLAFPAPLSVTLRETGGRVLGGATITFTAPASGASLAAPTTITRSTNTEGIATLLPIANGTTGSYTVTASVTSAAGAGSVNFVLTNLKAATLTSVTSTPNPSTVGDVITFTATVTAVNGAPTGTVTFYDNALSLGSGTLDANGVATLTTTSLAFGLHPAITATYAGSVNHFASTSGNYTQTVKANTTTSMTSAPNPSQYGQAVTFTATVTSASGIPTGTVTFYDNTTSLGSGALNAGGVATVTTTSLTAGTHPTITASYGGNVSYNGSTSSNYSQTVNKLNTATSLTSSSNPSTFGQAVTFTATVTSASGTPIGTVTFYDNAIDFGSGTLNASGVATLTTTSLTAGTHPTITATYGGNAIYNVSTSSNYSQTVNKADTAMSLTSAPNPSTFGQVVTFTATVTAASGVPDGTVQFYIDGSPCGLPYTLSGGKAITTMALLSPGTHPVTATYSGAGNFNASSGVLNGGQVVTDVPITGLTAVNSSPTRLTDVTFFTATIGAGSNVTYQWNFGAGHLASGATTSYTYPLSGTYTAIVTATNSVGSVSASMLVTVTNQRPSASAGTDQGVHVNALVTLDGSGSADPDGHLPLTYGWTQSGGPAVVLSSVVISRPTFTAPSAPAVLTYTLIVTDAFGSVSAPDEVVVLIDDQAITNLHAINDGPTRIGRSTSFMATIGAGSNALYAWDFGDGQTASGAQVNHRYAQTGAYTATVTATNGVGSINATTLVTIEPMKVYLPLVLR